MSFSFRKRIFFSSMLGLSALLCAKPAFSRGGESSRGDGIGFFVFFPDRQQERKQSRWSLSEWMSTKKTIAEQNLWLAKHTNKVPVDLTYSIDARKPGRLGHEVEFFLAWLGLHARYEAPWSQLDRFYDSVTEDPSSKSGDAGLALRLVGGNPQNTSLTVKALFEYDHVYGLSSQLQGPYSGWTFEPELQVYLAPWLGLRGAYRYRLSKTHVSAEATKLSGSSWWAGAFMEASSLRLEIAYESRQWKFEDLSQNLLHDSDLAVIATRLRLFF